MKLSKSLDQLLFPAELPVPTELVGPPSSNLHHPDSGQPNTSSQRSSVIDSSRRISHGLAKDGVRAAPPK